MALVRKRVVNVLLCHRLMTRRPNCPRLRPGDADPLVTCDTWRKPAAQAQKTELERQLKEAKDEARIPSSGASDSIVFTLLVLVSLEVHYTQISLLWMLMGRILNNLAGFGFKQR
jgi:hypothetical protein